MNESKLDRKNFFDQVEIKYRISGFLLFILGILFTLYVVIPSGSFENLLCLALAETGFFVTGILLIIHGSDAKYL